MPGEGAAVSLTGPIRNVKWREDHSSVPAVGSLEDKASCLEMKGTGQLWVGWTETNGNSVRTLQANDPSQQEVDVRRA